MGGLYSLHVGLLCCLWAYSDQFQAINAMSLDAGLGRDKYHAIIYYFHNADRIDINNLIGIDNIKI